ncbi:MAG: hypothetical protein ACRDRH_25280 [Pseudonocardia sp.]
MTTAAAGDTWGISGPTFLVAYVVITVAVGLAGIWARRASADRRPRPVLDVTAHPHDVAYLNGGPELAVYSALSSMHLGGTIAVEGRGSVRATARADIDALERAIHFAAASAVPRHPPPVPAPGHDRTRRDQHPARRRRPAVVRHRRIPRSLSSTLRGGGAEGAGGRRGAALPRGTGPVAPIRHREFADRARRVRRSSTASSPIEHGEFAEPAR